MDRKESTARAKENFQPLLNPHSPSSFLFTDAKAETQRELFKVSPCQVRQFNDGGKNERALLASFSLPPSPWVSLEPDAQPL